MCVHLSENTFVAQLILLLRKKIRSPLVRLDLHKGNRTSGIQLPVVSLRGKKNAGVYKLSELIRKNIRSPLARLHLHKTQTRQYKLWSSFECVWISQKINLLPNWLSTLKKNIRSPLVRLDLHRTIKLLESNCPRCLTEEKNAGAYKTAWTYQKKN